MADVDLPPPQVRFRAPSGNIVAADLVGDPGAPTVVYLHGTPDSRLARHPDDDATRAAGVRLVAVDRPGFGSSTLTRDASPTSSAAEVIALLDDLGVETFSVLAWSAGAIWALGLAAAAPSRVDGVTIVGGLVPFDAFDDPDVVTAAGDTRMGMVETARELGPELAGELVGGMLVPDPIGLDTAREHLAHLWIDGTSDRAHLPADVAEQMARALCDAVTQGIAGVVHDVTLQFTPSQVPLDAVTAPVRLVYGAQDTVCPPAFGRWYAARLPDATLDVIDGAGHLVLLERWTEILTPSATSGGRGR